MELRLLNPEEHGKTRELWEQVFPEDTCAFLDYYYFIKTQNNKIYVIEEDGKIRSMLQLNPYMLQIGKKRHLCRYVIAVSTEEAYRKRGYCRQLLLRSMEDLWREKEPFVYLMPASAAIYTPYGFRFVYGQKQAKLCLETVGMGSAANLPASEVSAVGLAEDAEDVKIREARIADAQQMAELFDTCKDLLPARVQYQVYAVRDAHYYQRMILEQQSENGGYSLSFSKGQLVGMFAYSEEGEIEILEPIFLPGYEKVFCQAVRQLGLGGQKEIACYALPESLRRAAETEKSFGESACGIQVRDVEEKPLIMARLLHLETLFGCLRVRQGEQISCSFAVIDTLFPQNNRIWKLENEAGSDEIKVCETEDSQGVLPVEVLTELVFGRKTPEEAETEDYVILTDSLKEEWKKLEPLAPVFLNEVV